jgi:hypothetical protein
MKFLFGFITCLVVIIGARFAWVRYTNVPFVSESVGAATTAIDKVVPFVAGAMQSGSTSSQPVSSNVGVPTTLPGTTDAPAKKDWLTPGQRSALSAFGISESSLPKELTPTMEACFVGAIGAERVAAVKAGATPTIIEMGKSAKCL